VRVKQPEVRHKVPIEDLENWLAVGGGIPAEVSTAHFHLLIARTARHTVW